MSGLTNSGWRNDVRAKVTGAAKFTDDLHFADLLHAVPVYSDEVHARIRSIETAEAERCPGVVRVLTARDVPGSNRVGQIIRDYRIFADDKIRYNGDVIAVVVAESRSPSRGCWIRPMHWPPAHRSFTNSTDRTSSTRTGSAGGMPNGECGRPMSSSSTIFRRSSSSMRTWKRRWPSPYRGETELSKYTAVCSIRSARGVSPRRVWAYRYRDRRNAAGRRVRRQG